MADIFKDILPSIMVTKKPERLVYSGYNAFLINRALSYHMDCVLAANDMNVHHSLDKSVQYDYLINTIRSKKRQFKKWYKHSKEENIGIVQEYYRYSRRKAEEVLSLLSNDQIDEIKRKLSKGGLNDKRIKKFGGSNPS